MGPADPRDMILEDMAGIVDAHRNDGASALLGNFKAAVVEFQKSIFRPVARPFRENADGDTGLDLVDGRQDGLHTGFDIRAVEKNAVQVFHPGIQGRNAQNLYFGHIAGKPRYTDVGDEDIEIASVIPDIQHWLVFWNIFLADHGHSDAGKEENNTEGPLDDRQRAAVFQARIVFADDVFRQLDRQADDQEDNNEEKNQN